MSRDYVLLEPLEFIEDRPFTNPVDSGEDLAWLQYMVSRLRELLSQPDLLNAQPRPFVLYLQENDNESDNEGDNEGENKDKNRYQRIALSKPELLLESGDITAVGFCGRRSPAADRREIDMVDVELIAEFDRHPYLLSYSTLQLPDGNSCNLVLFSDYRGLTDWAKGDRHAYAVKVLAPQYYHCIRLHNATLPGGINSGQELVLLRTKYYDYQGDEFWWGVRELSNKG